jgi:hypothetical protein
MTKPRLNTDEAFLSIMGKNPANKAPIQAKNETPTEPQTKQLVQTAFYITKEQQKALKMKIALSDRAEDRNYSAIVRSALDAYLADILKKQVGDM